jgi:hypothetical protein
MFGLDDNSLLAAVRRMRQFERVHALPLLRLGEVSPGP